MIRIPSLLTKLIIAIITFQTYIGCQNGPIPYNDDGTWKISIEEKSNIFYPNFCFMTELRYEKSDPPYDTDFYPLLSCINFEILLNSEDDVKQKVPYLKLKKVFIAKIIKTDLNSKDSNFDPEVLKDTKIDSPYETEDELLNDNFQFLVYQNFGEDSYSDDYHQIHFNDPDQFMLTLFPFKRRSYLKERIRFLVFGFEFDFINQFSLYTYYSREFRDKKLKNEDLVNMGEEYFDKKKLTFKFYLSYYNYIRNGYRNGVGPINMTIFPLFSKEMAGTLITKFEEFKSSTESHISSEIDPESNVKQLFRLPTESEKSDLVRDFTDLFEWSECADSLGKIDYIKPPKKNSQVDLEGEEKEKKDNSEETDNDNENENEKINDNNDDNKGENENKNKNEGRAGLGKQILMIVIVFSIFIIVGGSLYYFYLKKTAVKL